MFGRLFNPENGFYRATGKLFDALLLSILFTALCLPVVTIGPAASALYYTTVKCLRGKESGTFTHFFRSFKENFKVGAVVGIILTALWAFLAVGYAWLAAAAEVEPTALVMFLAYFIVLVIPAALTCFAFAALGRFTFGVGGLLKTALQLVFAHLPSALVVAVATVEAVTITLQFWAPVVIAPVLVSLVWTVFLERIFAPFIPPEEPMPAERTDGALGPR